MGGNALFLVSQESVLLIPEKAAPTCAAGVAGLPQMKVAFSSKSLQGHKTRNILPIV